MRLYAFTSMAALAALACMSPPSDAGASPPVDSSAGQPPGEPQPSPPSDVAAPAAPKAGKADKAKAPAAEKPSAAKTVHGVWCAPGETFAIGQVISTTPDQLAALQAACKARPADKAEVEAAKAGDRIRPF